MATNSIDEFFFNCINSYEGKMDKVFHSAKTVNELMFSHNEFKSQVLRSIPEEWRAVFGSKELPKNIKESLSKKIDETYQQLKHHFQSDKDKEYTAPKKIASASVATPSSARLTVAEKQKCQQDALSYYDEEMEKYFENNARPSVEDVAAQHKKIIGEVIAGMEEKGINVKDGVVVMTKLAIQSHYKETFVKKAKEASNPDINNIALGIDLGTTTCCVMVVNKEGKPEAILNRYQGNSRTTPSYVAYHENGTDTFGTIAKNNAFKYPENTIYDAKRMIGRSWDDANLQNDMKSWPFKVVNENGNPKIETCGRTKYPHEISARLLAQFRVMAEDHLNLSRGAIRKAVVTVPAYFTELQRRATNDAAECAGLQVLNILSEPTAAAIAYSYEKRMRGDRNALIYDLGGGTFDVAIAKVSETNVEVLVVDGDTHLGGEDFDRLLMEYCLEEFKNAEDYDFIAQKNMSAKAAKDDALRALSRVKLQCQSTKEELTTATAAEVIIEYIVGGKSMNVMITREKLNQLCRPLIEKTLEIVGRALDAAKAKGIQGKGDIHDVILVGGSTRMLLVSEMLEKYFNGKQLCKHINPDEAVAYGAAVQAAMLARKNENEENMEEVNENNEKEEEVNEEDKKVKRANEKANEEEKKKEKANEKTVITKNKEVENVDEEDGITQTKPKIKVQDVLPMSVGVEMVGQIFSPIILKNSKIPCKHSGIYWTAKDNQTNIKVKVFQGEAEDTKENQFLGAFKMKGFPRKPAGEEKVEVTMNIDSMGILQVEAMSLSTGNKKAITIVSDRLEMDKVAMEELRKKLEHLQTQSDDA